MVELCTYAFLVDTSRTTRTVRNNLATYRGHYRIVYVL